MKPNVGGLDRTLRIIGGVVLIVLSLIVMRPTIFLVIGLIIGIALLLTGLFRFCGLYPLLGINTCKNK